MDCCTDVPELLLFLERAQVIFLPDSTLSPGKTLGQVDECDSSAAYVLERQKATPLQDLLNIAERWHIPVAASFLEVFRTRLA